MARGDLLFAGVFAIPSSPGRRTSLRCCGPQWQPGSFGFSYLKHELSSLNGGGEKLIVAKQLVPVGRLAVPVNSQIM
jgi:hypothetical protein